MDSAGPRCIALTGGIGSGKSQALAAFARRGAAVLSSDDVVHGLYEDADVVGAVRERFGEQVINSHGAIDRQALGDAVFGDPRARADLEAITHPRIQATRQLWIDSMRAQTPPPPLLVCEVPLLFEINIQDRFDAVLTVTAPDHVRRARVEARGQDFHARASQQLPEDAKVVRADAAYVNEGSIDGLNQWVAEQFAAYARP